MKKALLVLALLLVSVAAYATDKQPQPYVDTPQSSKSALGTCENPIPIQAFNEAGGQAAETAYLSARYPGYTRLSLSRSTCNGKAAYRARFRSADHKKVKLYFGADGWAGKQ